MRSVLIVMCFGVVLARPQVQSSTSPPVAILESNREFTGDGNYKYSFAAENGIRVEEESSLEPLLNVRVAGEGEEPGPTHALVARGSFSYTAPDGTPITLTYIADQNGFQPQGAHLPTPPPIPEAIQRALASLPQTNQELLSN